MNENTPIAKVLTEKVHKLESINADLLEACKLCYDLISHGLVAGEEDITKLVDAIERAEND